MQRIRALTVAALAGLAAHYGMSVAAPARPHVRVAAVLDFSGKREATDGVMEGLDTAQAVLKRQGVDVTLQSYDSGTDGQGTYHAMKRVLSHPVDLVVAEIYSSKAKVAAELAEEAGRVMITPYATAEVVTAGRKLVFRACFSDAFLAKKLADFAWEDLGARDAALMVDAGQVYSQELAQGFKTRFLERGGQIVAEEKILDSMPEFKEPLAKVAALRPGIVLLPLYDTTAARVISQAAGYGHQQLRFLGGDGWGATKTFRDLVIDRKLGIPAFWVGHTPDEPVSDAMKAFWKAFRLRYERRPGQAAALGYDSLMLYAAALQATHGDKTPAKIADALRKLKGWQGASGVFSFEGQQDPAKSVHAVRLTTEGSGSETFLEIKP